MLAILLPLNLGLTLTFIFAHRGLKKIPGSLAWAWGALSMLLALVLLPWLSSPGGGRATLVVLGLAHHLLIAAALTLLVIGIETHQGTAARTRIYRLMLAVMGAGVLLLLLLERYATLRMIALIYLLLITMRAGLILTWQKDDIPGAGQILAAAGLIIMLLGSGRAAFSPAGPGGLEQSSAPIYPGIAGLAHPGWIWTAFGLLLMLAQHTHRSHTLATTTDRLTGVSNRD